VFEPDSPFQRYDQISENRASGPGVTDMKGGDVIVLEVLHALRAAGVLDRMQITVIFTGDEEHAGRPVDLARRELREAARRADYALGFEDGDGDPRTAVISRRGATGWRLETTGTPSHSSQIFSEDAGDGAIFEAARILDRFRTELGDEPHLTFNPGLILGGSEIEANPNGTHGSASGKANVVAARVLVIGDLRALSPEQFDDARSAMLAIAGASLPGCSAQLFFDPGYPPLAPTAGNRRLLTAYSQASEDLGFGPVEAVDPDDAGAADISFCSGLVDGALCGLGLMGTGGHTTEETADLRTLTSQAMRAAVLMWRLTRDR
jgi:glutamate carboxypeptidase